MTFEIKNIKPWLYGVDNAVCYLRNVISFQLNQELFLECPEFYRELNIDYFTLSIDEEITIEEKIEEFLTLEISSWTMEKSFASALFFIINIQILEKNLQSNIQQQICDQMKYVCSDLYSTITIKIYIYFDVLNLDKQQSIYGCSRFFFLFIL